MPKIRSAKELAQGAALIAALQAMPELVKEQKLFTVAEVAAILDEDPKQIHRAREKVESGPKEDDEPISETDLESIPFVKVGLKYKYPAPGIEQYLNDRMAAFNKTKKKIQGMMRGSTLGFQTWLAEASPLEKWPFSIQADGRPMDMCAAIILGKTTGDAESLTIREFGTRAADAALRAFHDAEAEAVIGVVSKPVEPKRRSGQRIDDR